MSAYIVNMETISVIADAFSKYGIAYKGEYYEPPACAWLIDIDDERRRIGQSLLCQNYASVNYRYSEDESAPDFEYKEVEWDFGTLLGCIQCYEYQACETPDYYESEIHKSLDEMKKDMLPRIIEGVLHQEIPWGYRD